MDVREEELERLANRPPREKPRVLGVATLPGGGTLYSVGFPNLESLMGYQEGTIRGHRFELRQDDGSEEFARPLRTRSTRRLHPRGWMRKVSAEYPVLRSARLRLRPFALADCAEVNRLVGDEAVASTLVAVKYPYSEDMARRWIAKHQPSYDAGGALNFAVEERASQALVGFIGIGGDEHRAGMGYWYGRPFWGKGYATEAGRTTVAFGFEELGLRADGGVTPERQSSFRPSAAKNGHVPPRPSCPLRPQMGCRLRQGRVRHRPRGLSAIALRRSRKSIATNAWFHPRDCVRRYSFDFFAQHHR